MSPVFTLVIRDAAAAGEIEGRALGVWIAIDLGDGQGVVGVDIAVGAAAVVIEQVDEGAEGALVDGAEDVIIGHGGVVLPTDDNGDRGGVASEVAVADGVGEGGAGGFLRCRGFRNSHQGQRKRRRY